LVLAASALAAGCDFFSNPGQNPTSELLVVSGDGQTAAAGTVLPAPLVVRALDAEGRGLAGQSVTFVVVEGGGSADAPSATTDDSGLVSLRWTLGTSAGQAQRLEARVLDDEDEPVAVATLTATAVPGGPAKLAKVTGDGQVGPPGEQLPDPLTVRLTDRFSNGIVGVTVEWSASSGSVSPTQSTTGPSGTAQTTWRLGTAVGSYSATASFEGVEPATFSAGTSLGGVTLTKTAGDAQSAPAGAMLPAELVVTLRGPSGQPVEGATVQWTVGADNGTVTPATSNTGVTGEARARWTMPATIGPKTLTASIEGQAAVTFTATSQSGAAASITAIGGNAQTGDVGAALADSLVVVVRDAAGNPVAGADVAWSVAAGGGTVSPLPSVTNASGVAKIVWTLGLKADVHHIVSAAVFGVTPASFTATPRIPASLVLAKTAGDAQAAVVGAALADSLEVTTRLPDGRLVEGVRVSWVTAAGHGTVAPRAERTAADGKLRARWTLGATPGSQQAVARWHGSDGAPADSVTFTATATAPPGAPRPE
jgi:hypothetical protein